MYKENDPVDGSWLVASIISNKQVRKKFYKEDLEKLRDNMIDYVEKQIQ